MGRLPRISHPGAIHLVYTRAIDGRPLFADSTVAAAAESFYLSEADVRCWNTYAYSFVADSLYILFCTRSGDLSAGMKRYLGKLACFVNGTLNRKGSIFQGRYNSILVEDGSSVADATRFVHLSPYLHGFCSIDGLKEYKASSYSKLWQENYEQHHYASTFLGILGIKASVSDLHRYHDMLSTSAEASHDDPASVIHSFCRGWFLGSAQYKLRLSRKLAGIDKNPIWVGPALRDLEEEIWNNMVIHEMSIKNIRVEQIEMDAKGAEWKIEIACKLRLNTSASNVWIAKRLGMGHPNRVSMALKSKKVKNDRQVDGDPLGHDTAGYIVAR